MSLGAGWFGDEHAAGAIPFPPVRERFEMMEEALEILTGMWATPAGERFSYDGTHFRVVDQAEYERRGSRPASPTSSTCPSRPSLQVLDIDDTEHLDLVAADVLPLIT